MSIESLASDQIICEFIMARHKGTPCLINSTYAPTGEVTRTGVRKYLIEVLDYKLDAIRIAAEPNLFSNPNI